ncbi:MAG: tetratricopeptide repeat protein [Spirochaetales bacterium]|nr:tetratricopeptide repeat protein [Spirochaetales bacterium]MCF7937625.1 tetratricopeptide repeat protein [Spirochaetales bacterium]
MKTMTVRTENFFRRDKPGRFRSARTVTAAVLVSVSLLLVFSSCDRRVERDLNAMKEIEASEFGTDQEELDTQELRKSIRELQEEVEQTVERVDKIGRYYNLIATRFMERGMFGPALEAFREAFYYFPENPTLYYNAGICSARLAKGYPVGEQKEEYVNQAEKYYQRAIEISPRYLDALYGLSVLYAFEIGDSEAAIEYARRVLANDSSHDKARFVLARSLVEEGRIEEAVDEYEYLEKNAKEKEDRIQAASNRNSLLGGYYEE